MRIAHLSDIHIRLKERHDEYKEVFLQLYDELSKQKPDRILVNGDIVHSKITLSPELVSLAVDFLYQLSMIAPLDIVVGNHDMNMSNMDRMDALTPIVDAARSRILKNEINYYIDTGLYEFSPGFVYGVYSLMDGGDIHLTKKDKDKSKVYIALYHGVVSGCKLDNEYVMSDSSASLTTFANFDFIMLGDIHKRQFINESKTAAYCGSLIQQNHGEGIEKGFLMWDIRSAKDFDCEFIRVHNDFAYATIYADDGILPDLELPSKTRIRVIWSMKAQDISRAEASRLNSLIRSKYNPLSVSLTFKPIGGTGIGDIQIKDSSNLADPDVQKDLLLQWFKNLDEEVDIDALMKIDQHITETVTSNDFEDFSNSNWHLKKISMKNFMSYDEEVEIDFDQMRGVIGLFGDNTAGKSVIIDAILYALFNKTTREVKNEELVNKYTGREDCHVKLQLEIRGVEYEIDRWTTRQYQKRSGRFLNARTDVTLKRKYAGDDEWENLTETQRNETEKIIRNAIGSFDDFMITTLSTQGGSVEFLKLKRSPRADIMLRFLGLDVFNRKYEYSKDLLKQVEHERRGYNQDYEVELLDTKKKLLSKLEIEVRGLIKKIDGMDDEIERIRKDISKHTSMINNTIKIDKDKATLQAELDDMVALVESLNNDVEEKNSSIETLSEKIVELEREFLLDETRLLELNSLKKKADKIKDRIRANKAEIESNKKVLKVYRADLENENKCPVVDDSRHTTCVFLRGFMVKKQECEETIEEVSKLQVENEELESHLSELNYVYAALDEQEVIRDHISKAASKLDTMKKDVGDIENKLEVKSVSINLIKSQLRIAESNEDTIRKNKEHRKAIDDLNKVLTTNISNRDKVNIEREELGKKLILVEREISDIEETLDKIRNSDNQYKLFNVYCNAMHRTGLPVDVLKRYIPKINYEINKILSDVVDFGVYLKIDEGETDIDIVMQYDGQIDDTRPAQMASGMEKLLINMAIRYALLEVSNLNTSSSWFIDEGFGVLDSENLFSMKQFFDNVRGVFRNIIIITHIDALKDISDWTIFIEKKEGISTVNSPIKNI